LDGKTSHGNPNQTPSRRTISNNKDYPLSITIATPSVTGTRSIHPPWPWVIGHVVLSAALAGYAMLKNPVARSLLPRSPPNLLTKTLQYLNFAIGLGAVVTLIRNTATGYISLPGIGVAIELTTLLIYGVDYNVQSEESSRNPYHEPKPTLFCYVSIFVFMVGALLYIVIGSYVINKGLANSMLLIVTTGCDNACLHQYTEQKLYLSIGGDALRVIGWGISSFFLGLFAGVYPLMIAYYACKYRQQIALYGMAGLVRAITMMAIVSAGGFAVAGSILDRRASTGTFYDCTNASLTPVYGGLGLMAYWPCVQSTMSFPGNALGFWDLWVRNRLAVLEGLVVW
jgi:hypothetical protein